MTSKTTQIISKPTLQWVEFKTPFSLPPHFIGQFKRGINLHLATHLSKWSEKYNGVPLGFDQVSITSPHGQIRHPDPHIFFDIYYKALIFSPEQGSIMIGRVVEPASDHISLLVYGLFHCSIPMLEIPAGYRWSPDDECWNCPSSSTEEEEEEILPNTLISDSELESGKSSKSNVTISAGDFLAFRVEQVKIDNHSIMSLVGSLFNMEQ